MSDTFHKLGEKLSAAIQAGDAKEAASLVAQLSNMKLKLDINIKKEELEQRNSEQEFSVRVHVEDRISDGCYFNLLVKSCDTIQDLKKKVMLKYNFPEEVQRWIIGKKIPENENKLSQCGVKGPGHTLYLYLVTARSVGLAKQEYEARRQALQQGIPIPHRQHNQSGLHSPVQRESPEPFWPAPNSPLETESHNYSESPAHVLSSSPVLGMGEVDQGHNSYGPSRQTSKRSLSSGSSLLQEMLMAPNTSILAGAESQSKPVTSESAANGLGHWVNDYASSPPGPPSAYKARTPSSTPPPKSEASPKVGWECPLCTYINLPVRPGCEMCSDPRPAEYKVPPGYQMTPEECCLLENEQRLEKMTREAKPAVRLDMAPQAPPRPGYYGLTCEQLRENLQLIEALNTHNNDTKNNNAAHRNSSGNIHVVGNDIVLVSEGSDWASLQAVPMPANPSFESGRRSPYQLQHGRSSQRNVSVVAPPSQGNQQQLPRNLQTTSHTPHAARMAGFSNLVPAQHEFSGGDFPSDDENS